MTLEVIEKVSQQIQEGLYHGASLALAVAVGRSIISVPLMVKDLLPKAWFMI